MHKNLKEAKLQHLLNNGINGLIDDLFDPFRVFFRHPLQSDAE